MYLCFDNNDININNLELYEILGSWNDWKKSIRLTDYDFIVSENLYIYIIETNAITISYKIRLYNTNEYILLDKLLVHEEIDGYKLASGIIGDILRCFLSYVFYLIQIYK